MNTLIHKTAVLRWVKSRNTYLLLGVGLLSAASYAAISIYYFESSRQSSNAVREPEIKAVADEATLQQNDLPETSTDIQVSNPVGVSSPDAQVRINGQKVQVPQNGSVHRVITDNNGTTTFDVSIDANSSGNQSSSSSTNIELNSTTELNSSTDNDQ